MLENGDSFQRTEIFVCLFYIPFENIFASIEISPLPVVDFLKLTSSEKSVHMQLLDTSIQKLYFYPEDCDNFV